MITTITSTPAKILQYYDYLLLNGPYPKFRDDSGVLKGVYEFVLTLERKVRGCEIRKKKYDDLNREFLELYGRVQEKEKEVEGKTEKKIYEPFYRIRLSDKSSEDIFKRLRYARYKNKARKNHEV